MKVIIAVDLSKVAEETFDWYIKNLHRVDNEVFVCHQSEQPDFSTLLIAGTSAFPQYEVDKVTQEYRRKRQEVEELYNSKAKKHQIQNFKLLIELTRNDPGHSIVKRAEEIDADMIVIGTRGMGAIRRTILGSVSDYVVHHSKIPVVICHGQKA